MLASSGLRSAAALGLAGAAVTMLPRLALAQTPAPLANWQYSVGDLLMPLMGPVPEWTAFLGIGASLQPRYPGAGRYDVQPAPIIDVHYRDLAFLSDGEGVGVNLLRGATYRAGIAATFDLGRPQSLEGRLRGLGNLPAAPEAKVFADIAFLPFIIDIDLRRGFGGHDGYIGDVAAHVPIPLADDLFLFVGPSVTFADGRYMQSYFGVTPLQSARSGLLPFQARGGPERAGLGLTAVYKVTPHWLLVSDGAAERLLGDAARSPIVETRTQLSADLNVVYKF